MTYTINFMYDLIAVLKQYANMEGSYSSTFLLGVAHYLCDSGIHSDSWSVEDMHKIKQRVGFECDVEDDALDAWYDAVHSMDDLDCNKILAQLTALREKHGKHSMDEDDMANVLAIMESELL